MSSSSGSSIISLSFEESEKAISLFQEFLRLDTVSATSPTTGAYKRCAAFLQTLLESLPVLQNVHLLKEAPDHSPVVVAHWPGKDPSLPVLLLNSHYDVVPADVSKWTVPPFDAVRKDGRIYGRGTQDMKCVCMQYIEAIRKISNLYPEWQPERSIYLTFVPDEEIGGSGMAAFLESDLYKTELPGIALALDEGLASTTNVFDVFYGERLPWWVEVEATGPTGHGSRFIENTAVEQIVELSRKALAFRTGQRDLLEMKHDENCTHAVVAKNKTLGDVTSLNITTLQAGMAVGDTFAFNVVPDTAKCTLDIRISPHMEPQEMKDILDTWCRECSKAPEKGSQVTWKPVGDCNSNAMAHATTDTDRKVNPWYAAFCDALQSMGCEISPQVFPAATDSRFLRALGIRALGFSPMRNTEILLHEHDEYILESNFIEGIGIFVNLIQSLGSQGQEIDRLTDKKRKVETEEKKDDPSND
ncbi:Ac-peptdase-euk: N-acyl-L-amino-acid amidohydrolase [Nitzschia inconspicua]|uniref:N-acyl-aliphatic-L-amino acid amidohydrolase n=1 Tax=Nitzschia inconspicua TaxID=303405 RepID=A0A9K3PHK9_9STRA|nr:Ac-peptdase-euk: N-acyl-L-amino-acid amidohydrolase [Nitzschia inconspicua]